VVADFSAAPLFGSQPLTVTFTNHSSEADDYLWDFGDGETSTDFEPTHVYSQAGVYTVTLQASGPDGTDSLVRPSYLTVTQPISVVFSAFPYAAEAPALIQFLNNSTGVIESYAWDFGDGITSTLPSPTHTYTTAGIYTVSLTANGPDDSQTLTKTDYLTITAPIEVHVTSPDGQPEAGLPVDVFNDATYTGDSQTTAATGVATFSLPVGAYRFRVDKNGTEFWSRPANHCLVPGCTVVTMTLSGPALPPLADFAATPISGTAPLTVTFINSSTNAVSYRWDFGDTMTSTEVSPSHTYTQAGVYTVTLTAIGADGNSTSLVQTNYLTVTSAVVADFSAFPLSGPLPLLVQFLNNSTGADSYVWAFGDDITSTLPSPTHTYTASGVYTISLVATGPGGTSPMTQTNYITVTSPLVAGFSAGPLSGTAPLTVTFTNSSTNAITYLWDFGDGITDTVISPTHTYTQAGVYTITLSVNDGSATDTLPLTNYITVYEPVIAAFSATPLTGTAPLTVTFANSSTGATDYLWDFGTGATLTEVSPTYTYTQPGVYTVTLTASGPGGSDTLVQMSYIAVSEPVVAAFAAVPLTGTVPLTVTFTNSSTGATDYLWDFGDGVTQTFTSSLGLPPLPFDYIYTQAGVYTVSLTARNGDTTDTLIQPGYITVLPEAAPLAVIATNPLSNGLVIGPGDIIAVTFSRAVSGDTINTASFTVRGEQTGLHTGVYTVSENTVQFAATTNFKPGEKVTVNLSETIQSTEGAPLTPYTWQFRAAVLSGAGRFSDSGQRLSNTSLQDVDLGDLDGDGDLDAFVGNYDDATIWLNDGAGSFGNSGQSLSNAYAHSVALGDLDGDGDLDAFIGNDGPNTVWLNDGGGNFSDSGQSLGYSTTYAVALADLDGDGDLDAFIGNAGDNQIWLNDGTGIFSDSGQSLGSSENYALTVGDGDSDGDLDAFVASSDDSRVWLNDGTGTFNDSGQSLGGLYGSAITAGDLDGDGDLDVLVANNDDSRVWLNDGTGTFSDSGQSLSLAGVRDLKLGDVEGDGDLDLLAALPDATQIWLNDGTGNFSSSSQDLSHLSGEVAAFGDLDSDGDLDVFVGRYYEANQVWLNQLPLTVTATNPSGNGLMITPNDPISAAFNRALSQNTVATRTFTVRGSQTGVYPGSYAFSDVSAQFTNLSAFKPGEEIVVNLSRGLKADDEVSLTPYVWQFRAEVNGGAGLFVDSWQRLGHADNTAVALGDRGPIPSQIIRSSLAALRPSSPVKRLSST
jgi:PKD repeat protein